MGNTGRTVQKRETVAPHASMYLPGTCDQSIPFSTHFSTTSKVDILKVKELAD